MADPHATAREPLLTLAQAVAELERLKGQQEGIEAVGFVTQRGEALRVVLADLAAAHTRENTLREALDAAMQYVAPKDRDWIERLAAADVPASVSATTEEPEVIFSIELNETDRARRAEEDRRRRS